MKKILIPVDFSEHTEITCAYALEIAKKYHAEMMLFHTYFDQIILTETAFPDSMNMNAVYNEGLIKELHDQAEAGMKILHAKLDEKLKKEAIGQVTITSHVVGGDIEMELKLVCEDYHPDMVVMGTRGQGRNMNIWGRVATYIINHAKVPVLTVPEMKSFLGFRNIMFAADLSENNVRSLLKMVEFMKPFIDKIFVVHFVIGKDDSLKKMEDMIQEFIHPDLRERIHFDLARTGEDSQKALTDYVSKNGITLIAFQPHKRNVFYNLFTKNITKKNLYSTNIPLLAMPVS